MAEWELVADDENTPNKVSPVRSSLRKLPGTAQVFAKPGEPVPASSLLRATRRTALSQRNHGLPATAGNLRMSRMGCRASVSDAVAFRRNALQFSAFGLRHFPNNSHRKFPPNNFPGRPLFAAARLHTTPSWMAMGIGPPQTTIKQNK
jgi:hypothetical protein